VAGKRKTTSSSLEARVIHATVRLQPVKVQRGAPNKPAGPKFLSTHAAFEAKRPNPTYTDTAARTVRASLLATTEDFITEAREVLGDKYYYCEGLTTAQTNEKVIITAAITGFSMQRPHSH